MKRRFLSEETQAQGPDGGRGSSAGTARRAFRTKERRPFFARVHQTGFTLVELITVIVIIGLLAGLLFPAISRSRAEARKLACRENLRKIGIGCHLYAQDFGDAHPTIMDPYPSTPLASLALLFDNYVQERDVFRCPSTSDACTGLQPGDSFLPHGQPPSEPTDPRRECSYGYDDIHVGRQTDPNMPVAADALPAPGEVTTSVSIGLGGGQKAGQNSANHRGMGQNVLCFDGHVFWAITCFAGIDGDNIYEVADENRVGITDSYIHQ